MLILLLIICIVGFIVGLILECHSLYFDDFGWIISLFNFCAAIIVFAFIMGNADTLINARYIDEKIAMYQEENETIESQIEAAVEQYMEYESGTYEKIKNDSDVVVMANLYPELKADSLVQEQIKTYQENNKTIKNLKSKKIDVKTAKWWLYFGK